MSFAEIADGVVRTVLIQRYIGQRGGFRPLCCATRGGANVTHMVRGMRSTSGAVTQTPPLHACVFALPKPAKNFS